MKDENDKRTMDLIEAALARSQHIPQGCAETTSPVDVRTYRMREGLCTYLPVSLVAKEWGVIPRRVRALLAAGRLEGRKQENGCWEVCYPYTITEGRRGPQMRRRGVKTPPQKVVLRAV